MIFTILIILFAIILTFLAKKINLKNPSSDGLNLAIMLLCGVLIYFFCQAAKQVTQDVVQANVIKARIQLMKPLEKYRLDVANTEMEMIKIERLINASFDKNNPNISVKLENGVKIYSLLGSMDFGSAEAGNAEKQKLLIKYIEKQNNLSDNLIYIKKLAYGEQYYALQQEYAPYTTSPFSGWWVKWFSIPDNYKPVVNNEFYPYESK